MPKSAFQPDPSIVQSGYYNDRNGSPNSIAGVGKHVNPVASATQETASSVAHYSKALQQSGGAIGGGAPDPAALMGMLSGKAPTPSPGQGDYVDVGGGFMVPRDKAPAHLRGSDMVNFGYEDGSVRKANPDQYHEPAEPGSFAIETDHEEGTDEKVHGYAKAKKRKRVAKHYAPASEDSTHPEIHNASDHTGMTQDDGEDWAAQQPYKKSGLEVLGEHKDEWTHRYYGTPLYDRALNCELSFQRALQKGLQKEAMDMLGLVQRGLKIELLEYKKSQRPAKPLVPEAPKSEALEQMLSLAAETKKLARTPLKKGGEGSRGGKVVGHTSSGRPIYEGDQTMDIAPPRPGQTKEDRENKRKNHAKQVLHMTPKERKRLKEMQQRQTERNRAAHRATFRDTKTVDIVQMKPEGKDRYVAKATNPSKMGTASTGRKDKEKYESCVQQVKHGKKSVRKSEEKIMGLEEWIEKAENTEPARDTIEDPAGVLDSFLTSDDRVQKAAGAGGLPDAGNPPSSMPKKKRRTDGDSMDELERKYSGTQSPAAAGVKETAECKDMDGENYEGSGLQNQSLGSDDLREKAKKGSNTASADLETETGGSKMAKALNEQMDWSKSGETANRLRSMVTAQLLNRNLDVSFGVGVTPPARQEEERPGHSGYIRKGLCRLESTSEDDRTAEALEKYAKGGTTFSQYGSAVNVGARIHGEVECGACGSLTKSMFASCEGCGAQLQSNRQTRQGLELDSDLSKAMILGEDPDIIIGE